MKELTKEVKFRFQITISNIEVSEGYYSFNYTYTSANGKVKKGKYDSDYEGWTEAAWKKQLVDGEAVHLVLSIMGEAED